MVVFVDDALSGFGDGNDAVGGEESLLFDSVNQGVATVPAGAVKFGSVDMGN